MTGDAPRNGETPEAQDEVREENSVSSLWDTAHYMLGWLLALCRGPCALVAEPWLHYKERRQILKFLRPLEGIVRRLLVIEAVRLAETLPPERKGTRTKPGARKVKKRPAPPPAFSPGFPDPEDASGWRVRFSMSEPTNRVRRSPMDRFMPRVRSLETWADILAPAALSCAAARHRERMADSAHHPLPAAREHKPSRRAGNPWPLAKRVEAVARVMANPEKYARRLARLLRKDPPRLIRSCRPPPRRRENERKPYGDGPLRVASELALHRLSVFRYRGSGISNQ